MAKRSLTDVDQSNGVATTDEPLRESKKRRKSEIIESGELEKDRELSRKELKKLKKEQRRQGLLKDVGDGDAIPEKTTLSTKTPNFENAKDKATKKADRALRKAEKKARKNGDSEDSTSKEPSGPEISLDSTAYGGEKTAYSQHLNLTALPQSDIDKYVGDNHISITDPKPSTTTARPITAFSFLPPDQPALQKTFKDFKHPTPIQAAAWPFLFSGRDVIGVAETGSGKTMAFAVPCIRSICQSPRLPIHEGIRALIVSPTRELAMQSYEQITKLALAAGLQTVCVYGGVPKDEQRRALRTAHVVVATPGRLHDLINEGCADLSKVSYLVLDEADRMLDKGFEEEIRKIISYTPPSTVRQTLMFTATWPESVRKLAATFMTAPVRINIGDNASGDLRANARIVQKVEVVDPREKEQRLLQLLKKHQSGDAKDDRILVFCLYKKEATRVEGFLRSRGIRVAAIHGDLSQEQRTRGLDAFKRGATPVLVATDVAARGLDIPSVKLVINCTFPLTVEDYVHRIGRTGRAGKAGHAITLFTEHDKAQSGALINVLKGANQEVPDELLKFGTTVKKKGHDAYGAFFKDVDSTKTATKIKFD